MWHRLKNIFLSFTTYRALSPDWHVRRRVNRALRHRPVLALEEWFERFCKPAGIAQPIAAFAYTQLAQYSGVSFAQVLLSDRLDEDLQWIQVCWFDWETTLCDDFRQFFQVDISHCFYDNRFLTVRDLLVFLNHQLLTDSVNS